MATVAVRVDDELKKEATDLFNQLGFDMSTAVKMFLLQAVHTKSIPFDISLPQFDDEGNQITKQSVKEAIQFLKQHAKQSAIRLDDNNPEHEGLLFDEDW